MTSKIFVLTWDGVVANLLVATAPDEIVAKEAIDNARANAGYVVRNADDLAVLSGPTLAVLYNKLLDIAVEGDNTEDHVSRFATRGDGQRRVFALLEEKFKTAPEAAAPSTGDTAATTETNEEGTTDMATKAKKTKTPKAPKAPKTPKAPRVKKEAKPKAGVDDFGLRKGSKASASAALFAREKGATMAEVKEKIGDTCYNLVNRLKAEGHKVKKDGQTIFLTAK